MSAQLIYSFKCFVRRYSNSAEAIELFLNIYDDLLATQDNNYKKVIDNYIRLLPLHIYHAVNFFGRKIVEADLNDMPTKKELSIAIKKEIKEKNERNKKLGLPYEGCDLYGINGKWEKWT